MKIIFLDFDGVIRMPVFGRTRVEGEFCHERMERITILASEHEAKIVISSDWRHGYDYGEIAGFLEPAIPREWLHRDWRTPILKSTLGDEEVIIPRGSEIVAWLFRNPDVKSFVILDDLGPRHFPTAKDRLVRCTLEEGFTDERFAMAEQILAK